MRCHSVWEFEPHTRDDDQLWITAGACAVFIVAASAAALWVGANSICIEAVGGSSPRCVVRPLLLRRVHPEVAAPVAAIMAISAAFLIPLVTGRRIPRGYWWRLAQSALLLGMAVGAGSGLWLAKRLAPDQFWRNPNIWTRLGTEALVAILMIWVVGLIVTQQALRDRSCWRLTQIFPDLEEGNSGGSPDQSRRVLIIPSFYDPVPYTPPSRDKP